MPVTAADLDPEITFISGVDASGLVADRSYWTIGLKPGQSFADKWPSGPTGTAGALSYAFGTASNWSQAEMSSFRGALGLWSSMANIRFTEVDEGSAELVIRRQKNGDLDAATDGWQGLSVPGTNILGGTRAGRAPFSLDINTLDDGFSRLDSFSPYDRFGGGFGPGTVVHELGHAIGLGHGGNYSAGRKDAATTADYERNQEAAFDSRQWTAMSYVDATDPEAMHHGANTAIPYTWKGGSYYYATTPGMVDVLAVQRLYGPSRHSLLDGNQTFGFHTTIAGDVGRYFDFTVNTHPVVTLFSTGRNNTLDLSGFTAASKVDLRPGTFSSVDGMTNNIGIALGTAIDRVVGGAGNDTFTLNGNGNTVEGGGGNDTVILANRHTDYSDSRQGATWVLRHGQATDRLTGVTTLRFSDGALTLGTDPLVDDIYYARNNADVFHAKAAAGSHYAQDGWREGRDPNGRFDTKAYLAVNPDVAAAGMNPLAHYDEFGWREGRDPSASFSSSLYLLRNPDVAARGIDPLAHYLGHGYMEGRHAVPVVDSALLQGGFDPGFYRLANPDVARAGADPLSHWRSSGEAEGRDPNSFFSTSAYLSKNPDVAAAGMNPLDHYLRFGWAEGRDPSTHFSTQAYLAHNPDVAAAAAAGLTNPLIHFLQFGIAEGRSGYGDGV